VKSVFVAAALAALMIPAHAAETSDDHWFNTGMAWYEYPCGLRAFEKYGHDQTPEIWRAYEITKQHPELCSKLFP
jgi:hypothetical protein